MNQTVLGIFVTQDQLLSVAMRVREYGIDEVSLLSPVPLTEDTGHTKSYGRDIMKFFTLFGGISGVIAGALFAIWTSVSYPLPRGGRPILAGPPILIISFETLILLGVLATFGGFLLLTRLPALRKRPYHDRLSEDRFGILVKVKEDKLMHIESILVSGGAEEVIKIED